SPVSAPATDASSLPGAQAPAAIVPATSPASGSPYARPATASRRSDSSSSRTRSPGRSTSPGATRASISTGPRREKTRAPQPRPAAQRAHAAGVSTHTRARSPATARTVATLSMGPGSAPAHRGGDALHRFGRDLADGGHLVPADLGAEGIGRPESRAPGNALVLALGDEDRDGREPVAVHDVGHRLVVAGQPLIAGGHHAEAGRQVVADPVGFDLARLRLLRLAVPREVLEVEGRLELLVLADRIEADVGELELLDRGPVGIDELGAQRECRFAVEPQAVAEPVRIVRPDRDQDGRPPGHPLLAHDGHVVDASEPPVAARQHREQRALVVPFLDQHRAAVRQNAMDLVADANDLELA